MLGFRNIIAFIAEIANLGIDMAQTIHITFIATDPVAHVLATTHEQAISFYDTALKQSYSLIMYTKLFHTNSSYYTIKCGLDIDQYLVYIIA